MRYRKPLGTHNVSVLQNVMPHLKNPLYKLPIYSTDLSFSRLQRYCRAQYYEPPNESSRKKKRCSLQSHQCNRYDELVDKLTNWDDSTPFIATLLAKDFEVVGTDAARKIKLLALGLNTTIPGLEIKPK